MTTFARLLFAVVALLSAGVSGPAGATPLRDFLAQSAVAYGHYRGAVNYLRTENVDLAAVELESARDAWDALAARFAAAPPDAFAGDPNWRETLHEIGARLKGGLDEIDTGRPGDAAKSLAPIRAMLADLRQRNNVRVFSDSVDELTAGMDRLWRLRNAAPDFAAPEVLRGLRTDTAVLGYLFARVRAEAPAGTAGAPEFERLVDGALAGIGRLWQAIDGADPELLINTLGELKAFERILYLRFG